MTPTAFLVIVPFLAILSSAAACADSSGSHSGPSGRSGSDGIRWVDPVPWAEGSGPIGAYFRTPPDGGPDAAGERARAARGVADLPEYAPERLSELLHGAGLFRPLSPGRLEIAVPVGHDRGRRVYVRIPEGYDPDRPWPLIVAYHGGGGDGRGMLGQIERQLGSDRDRYVIAAPSHYRQTSLDHPRPVSSEHMTVLHALQGLVHADADRVYVTGYSLGGYTTWHLATLHADRYAAAVPMASAFGFLGGPEGFWSEFFANFRHLPILSVWGGRDGLNVPDLNARGSAGSMSQVNRRFAPLLERHGASTVKHHEIPRAGHGGANPPRDLLLRYLREERVEAPREVEHWFRYIHQGHAYWIEGHAWQGDLWAEQWPGGVPGKRKGKAKRRGGGSDPAWKAIRDRLGMIRGTVTEGAGVQRLEVETRHLADLTVWIPDGLIDWSRPVAVVHNDREVFRGRLERDIGVALAQAYRTRDFDALRWAGIRIDSENGSAQKVTPEDDFPPVLREVLD